MTDGRPLNERPAARPSDVPLSREASDALKPPRSKLGCFGIGCFGIVIVVAVVVVVALLNGSNSARDNTTSRGIEARTYCEDAIRDRLKAPSTAEFESSYSGSGPVVVRGTVDAENSFGAMMRNTFQCTVTFDGDAYRISVDEFG